MRLAAFTLIGALAAASTATAAIEAAHPWIRATGPGALSAAGYVTLTNTGRSPDLLTGGSTPMARQLSVHQSSMTGGVMRMQAVPALPVPAGGQAALQPGGYHLMLTGLKGPMTVGQKIPVTLTFKHAGRVKLEFVVEQPGAPMGGHDAMPGMH